MVILAVMRIEHFYRELGQQNLLITPSFRTAQHRRCSGSEALIPAMALMAPGETSFTEKNQSPTIQMMKYLQCRGDALGALALFT